MNKGRDFRAKTSCLGYTTEYHPLLGIIYEVNRGLEIFIRRRASSPIWRMISQAMLVERLVLWQSWAIGLFLDIVSTLQSSSHVESFVAIVGHHIR